MRSAIAVIMALLGVLLVLSGAAAFWATALTRTRPEAEPVPAGRLGRGLEVVGRLPTPDRLIAWGVVLLVLSAVAAGAITFSATATAGTTP
jgi:hypothetical protein